MRPPQVPGLAVVIVGDRKDSATYVRMKKKACADVGIRSFDCDLPGDASQADVLAAVSRFNSDPDVHGILVQLPVRSRRKTAHLGCGQRAGCNASATRQPRVCAPWRGNAQAAWRKRAAALGARRGTRQTLRCSPCADRPRPRAAPARSCQSTSTRRLCCRPCRWRRTWMGSTRSTSGALR